MFFDDQKELTEEERRASEVREFIGQMLKQGAECTESKHKDIISINQGLQRLLLDFGKVIRLVDKLDVKWSAVSFNLSNYNTDISLSIKISNSKFKELFREGKLGELKPYNSTAAADISVTTKTIVEVSAEDLTREDICKNSEPEKAIGEDNLPF